MSIYIAGHRGMVGSAILRKLALSPNVEIVKDHSFAVMDYN